MTLQELRARWQADLETLRAYGDDRGAALLERCTAELAGCLAESEGAPVTLAEAAALSGYSASQLRRLVTEGKLENVSRNGKILLRGGDLPKKPGRPIEPGAAVQAVRNLRRTP